MNKRILFFAIIVGLVSTVFSQNTNTDHSFKQRIERRIQGDSITYSWEKANHFRNGLEAESKLRILVNKLKVESASLEKAYTKSENRNISYQDTIVPALNEIISTKTQEIGKHVEYEETLEDNLKHQVKKKWTWLGVGTAIGIIIMTLFSR